MEKVGANNDRTPSRLESIMGVVGVILGIGLLIVFIYMSIQAYREQAEAEQEWDTLQLQRCLGSCYAIPSEYGGIVRQCRRDCVKRYGK